MARRDAKPPRTPPVVIRPGARRVFAAPRRVVPNRAAAALATVCYDGPTAQEAFNDCAFDRFAYSDTVSLWFHDG
jgi:hypothetical protein